MKKKIIASILIFYPILDIIYGIDKNIFGISAPINQVLRGFILIYLITFIKNKKQLVIISIFSFFMFLGEIYYQLVRIGSHSISSDVNYVFKIIFFVVSIYAIENIIKQKILKAEDILKYMIWSTYIISISILISPFGLGFKTYAGAPIERFGYKGLFDIQNGITATLLIVAPLCIYMFYKTGLKRYLVNYLLILSSLSIIGTRSGLIGLILIVAIQMIAYVFITKWTKLKVILFTSLVLVVVAALFLSKNLLFNYIQKQIQILNDNWKGNWYSFLLSNRNLQVMWTQQYINSLPGWFNPILLFGLSYSTVNWIVHQHYSGFMSMEMDFYGVLYNSGIWVFTFITCMILIRAIASFRLMIKFWMDPKFLSAFLSVFIGIVHSFYGGHVIYEALPSLYFACILSISKVQWVALKNVTSNKNQSNKEMRISMIEPVGGHGGMNYYDFNLCKEIKRLDTTVTLFTCDETVSENENFAINKTFKKIYGNDSSIIRGLRFLKGLSKSIIYSKRDHAKIIHYHFFKYTVIELICVIIAKISGHKVVVTAHDIESFSKQGNLFLTKVIYHFSDRIIVHNNSSKNELIGKVHVADSKIRIIPHGNYINNINTEISKEDALNKIGNVSKNDFIILFFGQIKEVKGLDILINSIPYVLKHNKQLKVIVAGKVWKNDIDKYLQQIKINNIDEYFLLNVHYIPDNEVDYYFAAADLVVLPYKKIYQSGVLLNAMSYKKVVLASDLPGMKEIINDGDNGYTFKAEDYEDLANKLVYIMNNKEKMKLVENNAYNFVKSKHSWEIIAQATVQMYKEIY
ncbi:glycosyltransferase [Sporolactobacillus laevolacticus]|uniref:glycosyltransferase n=1 Tax=Sporolactobacillus laevolacticus TaxID=33018 RepID=UPI0025B4414D|nr:O-antigen ligase family protein [Sporolactobacillus laevolacticus]MDN3954725.1 O-antigen ligase family protein [Sporolactobacillus laevolacticus]